MQTHTSISRNFRVTLDRTHAYAQTTCDLVVFCFFFESHLCTMTVAEGAASIAPKPRIPPTLTMTTTGNLANSDPSCMINEAAQHP